MTTVLTLTFNTIDATTYGFWGFPIAAYSGNRHFTTLAQRQKSIHVLVFGMEKRVM